MTPVRPPVRRETLLMLCYVHSKKDLFSVLTFCFFAGGPQSLLSAAAAFCPLLLIALPVVDVDAEALLLKDDLGEEHRRGEDDDDDESLLLF